MTKDLLPGYGLQSFFVTVALVLRGRHYTLSTMGVYSDTYNY